MDRKNTWRNGAICTEVEGYLRCLGHYRKSCSPRVQEALCIMMDGRLHVIWALTQEGREVRA